MYISLISAIDIATSISSYFRDVSRNSLDTSKEVLSIPTEADLVFLALLRNLYPTPLTPAFPTSDPCDEDVWSFTSALR